MTREESIVNAYMLATNKYVPINSIPSGKRSLLTGLAIKFYRSWQTEPGVEWDSLYQVVGAGNVTAGDTFELDTDINFISTEQEGKLNRVRILHADGVNYTEYTKCKPGELFQKRGTQAVAKVADNSIKFSRAFTADDAEFGGTIQVPAIVKLDDILNDNSEILIDNPGWLEERVAAQYAYSFKSLRDMYDDLLAIANETMQGMLENNISGNESMSTGVNYFSGMGSV